MPSTARLPVYISWTEMESVFGFKSIKITSICILKLIYHQQIAWHYRKFKAARLGLPLFLTLIGLIIVFGVNYWKLICKKGIKCWKWQCGFPVVLFSKLISKPSVMWIRWVIQTGSNLTGQKVLISSFFY